MVGGGYFKTYWSLRIRRSPNGRETILGNSWPNELASLFGLNINQIVTWVCAFPNMWMQALWDIHKAQLWEVERVRRRFRQPTCTGGSEETLQRLWSCFSSVVEVEPVCAEDKCRKNGLCSKTVSWESIPMRSVCLNRRGCRNWTMLWRSGWT